MTTVAPRRPGQKAKVVNQGTTRGRPILDWDLHFDVKIVKTEDCWLWPYGNSTYGWLREGVQVHVYSYKRFIGPVPPGKIVHHTCENKRCANPDHLLAITRLEHRRLHPRRMPNGAIR